MVKTHKRRKNSRIRGARTVGWGFRQKHKGHGNKGGFLGLQYVRDPQRSFNEIAFLLGFAEPGNFTRAFKRWYGKSPSRYRESART